MNFQIRHRRSLLIISLVAVVFVAISGVGIAYANGMFGGTTAAGEGGHATPSGSKPRPTASPSATAAPTPSGPTAKPSEPISDAERKAVTTVPSGIALTIDDGPDPQWTPKYLTLLKRLNIRATFCLIGQNVREYPALVKQIVAGGNLLCNHSMNHDIQLGKKSSDHIRANLVKTTQLITAASGGVRPMFFRQPGGAWTNSLRLTSRTLGMTPLDWSIDPKDWAKPGIGEITKVFEKAKSGDIILCHDGGGDRRQTYAALQRSLPYLKERDQKFVLPTVEPA